MMGRYRNRSLRRLLLVCCLLAASVWAYSFINDLGWKFRWRSGKWEIACRWGRVSLDNEPQRNDEVDRVESARAVARAELRRQEAELHRAFDQASYGSDEYREALRRLKAWDEARNAAAPEPPAQPVTRPVEHSIPPVPVTAAFLCVFLVIFVGWRQKPEDAASQPIPRRSRIRGFDLACIVSLLLASITVWMWARSYQRLVRFALVTRLGEFSVMAERGQLMLGVPPAVRTSANVARARSRGLALRNSDVSWWVYPDDNSVPERFHPYHGVTVDATIHRGTPAAQLLDQDDGAELPVLLAALRDPRRALAAHVVLTRKAYLPRRRLSPLETYLGQPINWSNETYDGLRVPLTAAERRTRHGLELPPPDFDLSQLAAIRNRWHHVSDRISRPVPAWAIVAAAWIIPSIWTVLFIRRRRWRRNAKGRLCLLCGYNLTGNTSGVCPECGAACKAGDAQTPSRIESA